MLRGATSKIVGDLTQEIREKLEPTRHLPGWACHPTEYRLTTWRQG